MVIISNGLFFFLYQNSQMLEQLAKLLASFLFFLVVCKRDKDVRCKSQSHRENNKKLSLLAKWWTCHISSGWVASTWPLFLQKCGSWAKRSGPSEFLAQGEVSVMGLLSWLFPLFSASALIRQIDSDVVWALKARLAHELCENQLPFLILAFWVSAARWMRVWDCSATGSVLLLRLSLFSTVLVVTFAALKTCCFPVIEDCACMQP